MIVLRTGVLRHRDGAERPSLLSQPIELLKMAKATDSASARSG